MKRIWIELVVLVVATTIVVLLNLANRKHGRIELIKLINSTQKRDTSNSRSVAKRNSSDILAMAKADRKLNVISKILGAGEMFRIQKMDLQNGSTRESGCVYYSIDGRVVLYLDYDINTITRVVIQTYDKALGEWKILSTTYIGRHWE